MWAALVVGLLFLAGAAIAALLIGLFFFSRHHEKRSSAFSVWMAQNAAEIERGGAHFESWPITPATVLVRYQVALSFLIVAFKMPTRQYIHGEEQTTLISTAATAVSLVFGWWGIPWGPVYTLQAIGSNVRGGLRSTVAEHLAMGSALASTSQSERSAST